MKNRVSVRRIALVAVLCLAGTAAASAQTAFTPQNSADIGQPALPGTTRHHTGLLMIDAAGTGPADRNDQFHFAYRAITGDVDVRVRVDSITRVHAMASAGVMIRSNLGTDAAHGYALVSAGHGVAFHRRKANRGSTTKTQGPAVAAPRWVRLVRVGKQVTGYTSPDGLQWTLIASDQVELGAAAYVGLAVASSTPAKRTAVRLTSASATALLPPGQLNTDIGAPALAGSAMFADGRYTISASGRDIWDAADQFHYVYQQVSGDIDVSARVASVSAAAPWSKAGVMIRETLDDGARHASVFVSSGKGNAFQRRPHPDHWSENTGGGSGKPPGWVRLVRSGFLLEAYRSTDGKKWTKIGSDTVPMHETVYVGIAVTSASASASTVAVVDNLRVTEKAPPANKPPTISLTSPTAGTVLDAPGQLAVAAAVTDADGSISMVEFYANSTLLGRVTKAPYSLNVASLAPGSYTIKAVAIDNEGASTTSAAAAVTVKAPVKPPATPPAKAPFGVAFTASDDHATLVTRYVLEIYKSGATPGTSTPVVTSDLGKPSVVNGEITVERAALFSALSTGNYIAAVTAVGATGSARSAPVAFTR